jgi:hypothetical protein
VMHDWANLDDPVGGYGVTHLVSPENGFEEELFWKLYPELMERATEIGRCQIRDVTLSVFELPIRGEQPPLPKPSQ